MGKGVNKVILIGNLGADPDIRYTPSGSAVANLSVATDESYKDKQTGQMVPKTEWHRVSAFGKLADICGQYLKKGSKVYVEGKLQTRKWQDQQGQDRYTTEILANEMRMLDGQQQGQNQQPPAQQKRPAQQPPAQYQNATNFQQNQQAAPPNDLDDDIPFTGVINTLAF